MNKLNQVPAGVDPCVVVMEHLLQIIQTEADEDLCEKFQIHVASCEICSDNECSQVQMRQLLRRACTQRAPESLRMRVMTQIQVMQISE